jgi:hypothetical protein
MQLVRHECYAGLLTYSTRRVEPLTRTTHTVGTTATLPPPVGYLQFGVTDPCSAKICESGTLQGQSSENCSNCILQLKVKNTKFAKQSPVRAPSAPVHTLFELAQEEMDQRDTEVTLPGRPSRHTHRWCPSQLDNHWPFVIVYTFATYSIYKRGN